MNPKKETGTTGSWKYLLILCICAFIVRLGFILAADFPLNQGGMFYGAVKDIIANNFRLPYYLSYNHDSIPFSYSPLSFYIAAALNVFAHIPLVAVFRFLPLIVSIATVPLFYLIGTELLGSSPAALVGTFLFIVSGGSFQALIEGGGLTRSFGLTAAMASVYLMLRFYRSRRTAFAAAASVTLALSLLFHIETSVFAVYSLIVFYLILDRSLRGFITSWAVGIGSLLIASPWLVVILHRYGLTPFLAATHSNPWNLTFQQLSLINFVGNPAIQMLPFLYVLGFLVCIDRKRYAIPLWALVLVTTASRMVISTTATVPLSLAAGAALSWFIIPKLRTITTRYLYTVSLAVLALTTALTLWTSYWHTLTPFEAVDANNRTAMEWVRRNTEESSQFLVVTAVPAWGWFLDKHLEWFPALAERRSITTVQGSEWLPNEFMHRLNLTAQLKDCNGSNVNCVEAFIARNHLKVDYIYVTKAVETDFDDRPCCQYLKDSLSSSGAYRLVYYGQGAAIWKRYANVKLNAAATR